MQTWQTAERLLNPRNSCLNAKAQIPDGSARQLQELRLTQFLLYLVGAFGCATEVLQQQARRWCQFTPATNTNMQLSQRPLICQPGYEDGFGFSTAARCRLRYDSHSDARSDHAAGRIEAAEAHAQFQRLSGLDGPLREMLLKGVCRRQTNELVIEQRSKHWTAQA